MPATAGLLQSPRPTLSGPPGLLGPPPNTSGVAPPTGPPIGQGPMDLEEQGDQGREHDDRRDRGRDRDRDRDRDRRDRDGDRRSGGRWEDSEDRRDRDGGRRDGRRDDREMDDVGSRLQSLAEG